MSYNGKGTGDVVSQMNDNSNNNDNNRAPTVRELYRTLTHIQTHLV